MNRTFIRNNITSISIIIFIILFTIIQIIEPAFLYDRDGSFRSFGIGKQKKNNHTYLACYNNISNISLFICFILFSNSKILRFIYFFH